MTAVLTRGTAFRFNHTKRVDPKDRWSPRYMAWASHLGELDESYRLGSRKAEEALREQAFISNFLTDQGENDILDVFFRGGTAPTFFFGLWNATPGETSDLTLAGEVTGTGYGRRTVTRDATGWPTLALNAGDFRVTSRTETFTAGGAWTSATRLFLVSVLTGTAGRLYAAVALGATRTLANTDQLNVSMAVTQS